MTTHNEGGLKVGIFKYNHDKEPEIDIEWKDENDEEEHLYLTKEDYQKIKGKAKEIGWDL